MCTVVENVETFAKSLLCCRCVVALLRSLLRCCCRRSPPSLSLSSPSPPSPSFFVEGSRWKPSLVADTCTRQHTVDNVRMQRMVWRFCLLHASGDGWLHNTRETHVNSVDHTWARQYPRRVLSAPCCCLLSAVVVELMVGDASPPDGA